MRKSFSTVFCGAEMRTPTAPADKVQGLTGNQTCKMSLVARSFSPKCQVVLFGSAHTGTPCFFGVSPRPLKNLPIPAGQMPRMGKFLKVRGPAVGLLWTPGGPPWDCCGPQWCCRRTACGAKWSRTLFYKCFKGSHRSVDKTKTQTRTGKTPKRRTQI